jgi:hypothetical protein
MDTIRRKPLPEHVIVKPLLGPLLMDGNGGRDIVTGHLISATTDDYTFSENGADHIFYSQAEQVQKWMAENGYKFAANLQNRYMATPNLHGLWVKN